jgi:glutamate synthase domain-containing protein 3
LVATVIDAARLHYRDLNAMIRQAASAGETDIELVNVNGQRYIAGGVDEQVRISVAGVAGNDLGAFMNGPRVTVRGNAQDAVGNTMNEGTILIHGHAGDVLGYGMRGGKIFVRGDIGYRVGIHMKAYRSQTPVLIAGGSAGDFLGEYMAGGILVVLGMNRSNGSPAVGDYCATGMHGGAIYVRGSFDDSCLVTNNVKPQRAEDEDIASIRPHLEEFSSEFGVDLDEILSAPFVKLVPSSHRPYGSKYAA